MTNPPEYPLHSLQQLSAVAERRGHDIIDLGMGNPDQRYSFLNLARDALRGNRGWLPALREPTAKSGYEVVVVGGGGHGLATAYYLARKHGVHNVAVLEKAWIGGGIRAGTLRLPARTTSIRSVPRSTSR